MAWKCVLGTLRDKLQSSGLGINANYFQLMCRRPTLTLNPSEVLNRCISSSPRRNGIISSPHPDVIIPENQHLTEYMFQDFDNFGQKPALIDGISGQSYSYNELKDKIVSVASGLTKRGFKKGEVLAIYSHNLPDYCVALLGAILAGGIVTPANPQYTTDELGLQLKRSGAKVLVTVPSSLNNALLAVKQAPTVQEIFVMGEPSGGQTPFRALLDDDRSAFNDSQSYQIKEDLAALPYSSGTTGLPKGVMLTHYNLIANIEQLKHKDVMNYQPDDSLLAVLPFFHIYGQVVILLTGLRCGSTIVTLPKFDPEIYLQSIQKYKSTYLHIVPPMAIFLANHPLVDKYIPGIQHVHTVFTGAAPSDTSLGQRVHERLKIDCFRQGYGLTETSPVTHCNPMSGWKYGSIGVAVPNTKFKVVDIETGETLPENKEGELCVQGPQVMKGYADNEEATKNTIRDHFLHTGDLGYYDKDGHVFISDRLKELIKYKGFQVPPAELEGLLLTHPMVEDSAVIGIPDERAGELPKAFVVLKKDTTATTEDIQKFVEEKVSPHKYLRGGVEFIEQIPKSASGKILRRMLKNKQ